jgi:hypothetical protein
MKTFYFLCGLSLLGACQSATKLNVKPAITAAGMPTGPATTATIGVNGGTLKSPDGKVELIVPPAALPSDVMLSVTPISSTGPGAVRSYRFGPEGTKFATPVTMRFNLEQKDLAGTDMTAMGIAFQDAKNRWQSVTNSTVAGNSISVNSVHLSDWTALHFFQLSPAEVAVKVKATQPFSIQYCNDLLWDEKDPEAEPLTRLVADCQTETDILPLLSNWSVDGNPGGNATIGTIAAGNIPTFTAPEKIPSNSTVAVSVDAKRNGETGGRKVILISKVKIIGDGEGAYTGGITLRRSFKDKTTRVDVVENDSYTVQSVATFRADLSRPDQQVYVSDGAQTTATCDGHSRKIDTTDVSGLVTHSESKLVGTASWASNPNVLAPTIDVKIEPSKNTYRVYGLASMIGTIETVADATATYSMEQSLTFGIVAENQPLTGDGASLTGSVNWVNSSDPRETGTMSWSLTKR